jgi:hypothetical protein
MNLRVTAAFDLGNDVLQVQGYDADTGELCEASGWVSATTNYYPPESYDADGNRLPEAQPRAMTAGERRAYCQELLVSATSAPRGTVVSLG